MLLVHLATDEVMTDKAVIVPKLHQLLWKFFPAVKKNVSHLHDRYVLKFPITGNSGKSSGVPIALSREVGISE